MKIEELPINDNWAQYFRSAWISEECTAIRQKEMSECDHLFVRLKNGINYSGYNSSDCYYQPSEVECVHCGLTNKYHTFEEELQHSYDKNSFVLNLLYPGHKTIESEMFNEFFKDYYSRGNKSFDESCFNLISPRVLPTYHPGLLYSIAIQINPDASKEELFSIMEQLHAIETEQEVLRLQTVEQAQDLILRYTGSRPKVRTIGSISK